MLLRYDIPPEGRAEARVTSTYVGRAQLFGLGAVVLSQLAMIGAGLAGYQKPMTCEIGLAILLPALPMLIYMLYKADRHQRETDQSAREPAIAEWESGEAAVARSEQLGSGSVRVSAVLSRQMNAK